MKSKLFRSAPLPFQGQKRRFSTAFELVLKELKQKQDVRIIVDLFGGSGLLSHTAKAVFPDARVIYNDYDGYTERLRNVSRTNSLLSDLRIIIPQGLSSDQRLSPELSAKILSRIKQEDQGGFVDYITISASLTFSGKYANTFEELSGLGLYNKIKVSDYEFNAEDYLCGLEIVHADYKQLYQQYKDEPGVVFVVDPPYLSTDTSTYGSDKYWKLKDYLDVLHVLVDSNYIFFTSNKSSIVDLCEWIENNRHIGNPFSGSVLNIQQNSINYNASYTDMMLYKFVK